MTTWLVELFARLPLANISVPAPNPLEILLLYGFILGVFSIRRRWQGWAIAGVAIAVLGADGTYWWSERQRINRLRITHLNVGQGDAAVVELPGGKVLLVDAGGAATGDFDTGEAIVAPFLRSRKIVKVDYLFVSHARIDHYGGMRALVKEFLPSEFWSGVGKGQTRRFEDLEEELERHKIPRAHARREPTMSCHRTGASLCTFSSDSSAGRRARGPAYRLQPSALSVRQRYRQTRRSTFGQPW